MTKRQSNKGGYEREYLETLIEEATVDCYDEYEQATGLFTMIEDELEIPFTTRVLGMEVAVVAIEQDDSGLGVVAVCERRRERRQAGAGFDGQEGTGDVAALTANACARRL